MRTVTAKILVILGTVLALGACTKLDEDRVNGNAQLQVRLTDAPGDFDAVFIEVEDVLVHRSGGDSVGEEGWESIEGVRRGIYNLLDLVNGRDTLLVDANVPAGHLGYLRLVLGEENRVETGGRQHKLAVPAALQPGLDLKINGELRNEAVYELLLDVDVARSVIPADSGDRYVLWPVVRVLEADAAGGTLRGVVSPAGANMAVLAVKENDTLGTYTDTLGNYLLKAVPPGSYSMHFMPDSASGLPPLDTTGIAVNNGEISQVNVTLQDTLVQGPDPVSREPAGR